MLGRTFALVLTVSILPLPVAAQNFVTPPTDTVRVTWSSRLEDFPAAPSVFAVVCPASEVGGTVWGTDEYTDDSTICMAAIHSGVLTTAGGVAILQRRPGLESYTGSERNGVTTLDYGAWPRGFRFVHPGAASTGARAQDVGSIDGIIRAFYEVVSGPAGAPRQWGRDATLYLPGASFTIANEDGPPRTMITSDWSREVDEWLVSSGFTEREIHRTTHAFGRMAHVWSTYEWQTADGKTGRGINSIHLWHDGSRWWITHATWEDERPDNPIPPEDLP